MKKTKTNRGFSSIEFEDYYKTLYNIQKSSLATKECIWIGINHPELKIKVSDAVKLGLRKNNDINDNDWIEYKIPNEVFINSRMHLTREQVAELLPILENFVKTGNIF